MQQLRAASARFISLSSPIGQRRLRLVLGSVCRPTLSNDGSDRHDIVSSFYCFVFRLTVCVNGVNRSGIGQRMRELAKHNIYKFPLGVAPRGGSSQNPTSDDSNAF